MNYPDPNNTEPVVPVPMPGAAIGIRRREDGQYALEWGEDVLGPYPTALDALDAFNALANAGLADLLNDQPEGN